MFKCRQRHQKYADRKKSSEKIGFSRKIQASLALKFRLIYISIPIYYLVYDKQNENHAFVRRVTPHAVHEGEEHGPCRQSHNTCYVPVLQIIPKGILACSVRNLEGTDTKISYNKHLLSQSGKSEGKDTSLVVSHHPYDQKRQNHAGQCIDKTPCNIPDHVLPSDIRSFI